MGVGESCPDDRELEAWCGQPAAGVPGDPVAEAAGSPGSVVHGRQRGTSRSRLML
jgi:hypothetical protein